jgi:L-threonylcarbamoyladenylate synthase
MSELVSIAQEGADAARAALERCITEGGVAVFPSDGLYGLACDPTSAGAIERIQALKGRDARKPSAVLYLSPLAMRELLPSLGPRSRQAIAALLPGPLTLVLANPERRYPLACREDPERLGVRLIEGPLGGAMCPLFQTSANPSGASAPASLAQVDPRLRAAADLAIDGGELPGTPSTVVDLTEIEQGGGWRVLRQGAVSREEVERKLEGAAS